MRLDRLAAALLPVTSTASALAQVNVEAVRGDATRPGLSGRVEASVTGSTGNSEGIVAGGSGRVQLRRNDHLAFVHATGGYARLNQTTSAERALVHTRYNYELEPWLWGELFGQLEHDAFRRLTNREILGAGPRLRVLETEAVDLYYGTSYMAEWENLDLVDTDPDDSLSFAHRWNHYLTVSASLADHLEAGSTVYLQPRIDRFSDYRLLHEVFLEVGITDVVSTKVSTWMRHDSDPPDEVKRTDFTITNAFVAEF
jgi:putative salt-induced outer membrane protein YdiY